MYLGKFFDGPVGDALWPNCQDNGRRFSLRYPLDIPMLNNPFIMLFQGKEQDDFTKYS